MDTKLGTTAYLFVLLLLHAEVTKAQPDIEAGQSCEVDHSVKVKDLNRNYYDPRFTSSCQMPPKDFIVLEFYIEFFQPHELNVEDLLSIVHPILQRDIPEAYDMFLKNRLHRLNPERGKEKKRNDISLIFAVDKDALLPHLQSEAHLRNAFFRSGYNTIRDEIHAASLGIAPPNPPIPAADDIHAMSVTIADNDQRVNESCDFYDCTQYSTCHEANRKVYCISDCAAPEHGLTCTTEQRCWQPHYSVRARCRRKLNAAIDGNYMYTTPENMKSVDDVMVYFYTIVIYLLILLVAIWIRRMWRRNVAVYLALKYEEEGPPVEKVLLGRVVTLYHVIE